MKEEQEHWDNYLKWEREESEYLCKTRIEPWLRRMKELNKQGFFFHKTQFRTPNGKKYLLCAWDGEASQSPPSLPGAYGLVPKTPSIGLHIGAGKDLKKRVTKNRMEGNLIFAIISWDQTIGESLFINKSNTYIVERVLKDTFGPNGIDVNLKTNRRDSWNTSSIEELESIEQLLSCFCNVWNTKNRWGIVVDELIRIESNYASKLRPAPR